jgi:hypothetical protein
VRIFRALILKFVLFVVSYAQMLRFCIKNFFGWTIIGGDRILLRMLRLRRTKDFQQARKKNLFLKPQMSPSYLLIKVFPIFDPLTATWMVLYRKMSKFI